MTFLCSQFINITRGAFLFVVMRLFVNAGESASLNLNTNFKEKSLEAGPALLPNLILSPCTVEWLQV